MPAPAPAPAPGPAPLDARTLGQLKELGGDDDPEFLPTVLRSFLDHLGTALAELDAAAAKRDGAAVKRVAHSLKGGAGNVGARALASCCAAMEVAAVAGADLARPWADVCGEAARVRACVEAELRKASSRG